jgi:hypothetical protein
MNERRASQRRMDERRGWSTKTRGELDKVAETLHLDPSQYPNKQKLLTAIKKESKPEVPPKYASAKMMEMILREKGMDRRAAANLSQSLSSMDVVHREPQTKKRYAFPSDDDITYMGGARSRRVRRRSKSPRRSPRRRSSRRRSPRRR